MQTRPQGHKRLSKVWEDPNIKVAHAMSDLLGTRGRWMLQAWWAGERTPTQRAAFALGTLRRQVPALALPLTGQCTAHHGRLIQGDRALMESLERQRADLDEQSRHATAPFAPRLEPLHSRPGLKAITARDIIAESGTAMGRVGSARRVSSWAGVSPGHNERAGQRRKGRTGTGHRSRRRVLVPWAWAARNTPTCSGRTFRRWERRLGRKTAAMAVAHTSLVIISHLRAAGTFDDESRDDRQDARQEERAKPRALAALARLGSNVPVSPGTEAAAVYAIVGW